VFRPVEPQAPAAGEARGHPTPAGIRRWKSFLGPGLITGASDDDPSGIATYSQAGAQFGFDMGWTLIVTFPLMCAVQEVSARIGRVTGRGLAGNFRRYFPRALVYPTILLLVFANTINLGADLGAMGAALELVLGGPAHLYVILFALLSCALEIFTRYARYQSILKWLTLSLFSYVAVLLVVRAPWMEVGAHLLVPRFKLDSDALALIVAILGTTISPYLFFWQAQQEVEDTKVGEGARPLIRAPEQSAVELRRIHLDTYVGMGFSNLVALSILLAAATTLHARGITDIQTSAQAAEALRPVAGEFAFLLFALGIIGTGLLALPVLAGSAAYALGEILDWHVGLSRAPGHAKLFYSVIAAATLLGTLINFTELDPVRALVWAAVVNGVAAVPILALILLLGSRSDAMGAFTTPRALSVLGWLTTFILAFAAIGMIATAQ
jgi:NRAMP (natural resistance-associated macrophage protein)-like metal ion transporter